MQAADDAEHINNINILDNNLNLDLNKALNKTEDKEDNILDLKLNNYTNSSNDNCGNDNTINPAFIEENIINRVDDIAISDILNSMDEAVIITDNENKILFCNNYFSINFNISLNNCLNKNIKEISFFQYLFSDDLIVPLEIRDLASGYKVTNIHKIDNKNHYFENDRIPIYDHSGETKGIIYLIRDITKEIKFEQKLNLLAKTDSLSGLYNSRYFYEELEKEIARSARYDYDLALMFIDIDNFKMFNDTFSHKAGDEMIKYTAAALNNSVRKKIDAVCRYGGDEFVAILPNTNAMRSTIVANRILNYFDNGLNDKLKNTIKEIKEKEHDSRNAAENNQINIDSHLVRNGDNIFDNKKISLSIGISEYKNGKKAEELINEADGAMYKAKQQNGGRFYIYK
ncbi:MAG: GGDEF domain-containing protein [bacterium]